MHILVSHTRLSWVFAIGLATGVAFSQEQGGRGFGRGRFPVPNVGFAALDTNGDGVLDAQEIDAAPASLARLDKNADGRITADEVRPAMPEGRGEIGRSGLRSSEGDRGEGGPAGNVVEETVKSLMAFDANGDGKLSRDELPERMRGMFDRGDEDKDGFLSREEIRKLAAAQAGVPLDGPRGPSGPDGPGRGGRGEGFRGEVNLIRIDPVLAAVDTDGDGTLSAEEIKNAPAALRKLDKNGDGKVTRDEAVPTMGRGRA